MRANFPPFTRKPPGAPEHAYRAPELRTAAPVPVSDRESKLRTLKHYLYHAGLLLDELLAADSHVAPQFAVAQTIDGELRIPLNDAAAEFTRDRDATGA